MVVDGEGRWYLIHSSVGVTQSMIIMSAKPSHGGCSDQDQTELLIREQDLLAPHWVMQWVEMLSFSWRSWVQVSVSAITSLIEVLLNKTLNLNQQPERCSVAGSDLWTLSEKEGSEKRIFFQESQVSNYTGFPSWNKSLVMPKDILC